MAGRGPAPKDPAVRRRTSKASTSVTQLRPDGKLHGPELPAGIEWHAQTRIWWDNWRRSPQGADLAPVEWDFLLDTARIHSEFWMGDSTVAGELRLRVAKFGATLEDRARLKITASEQPKPKPAPKARPSGRAGALRIITGAT